MFKSLLILFLVFYVLYKISGFFFRIGASSQQRQEQPRPPEGNININTTSKKEKKGGEIKGGEYVDYEEVK